jgi:hypothetical protein
LHAAAASARDAGAPGKKKRKNEYLTLYTCTAVHAAAASALEAGATKKKRKKT